MDMISVVQCNKQNNPNRVVNSMKNKLIILSIIFVLFVSGCNSFTLSPKQKEINNVINGGYAASHNGFICYVNGIDIGQTSDNMLYMVNADWSGKVLLSRDKVKFINFTGDWIYYSNISDGGKLYKMKSDGTNRIKLNEFDSSYVNVLGDWIYYINGSVGEWKSSDKLYKIKTNGTEEQIICDDVCENLIVHGDWLFYLSRVKIENGRWVYNLFKIKQDGTGKTQLSNEEMFAFSISDTFIIYHSASDGLYRIDFKGAGKTVITNEQVLDYNIDGEWVYYCNLSDNERLYRIMIDGSNKQKLNDDRAYNIHIVGEWIYYASAQAENTDPYRVKTDGTEKSAIT